MKKLEEYFVLSAIDKHGDEVYLCDSDCFERHVYWSSFIIMAKYFCSLEDVKEYQNSSFKLSLKLEGIKKVYIKKIATMIDFCEPIEFVYKESNEELKEV